MHGQGPDAQTKRLALSALLGAQVRRRVGGIVTADADADTLVRLACHLAGAATTAGQIWGVCFEPAFPGATAGVAQVGRGLRLLLACRIRAEDGAELGVVFTTLIPGRAPVVSVAPEHAPFPDGWAAPASFL
jgi:hypothetical protein